MTVFTILSHHQGVQARHRSSKHSDNVNRRNCVSGFPSLPDSWEDRVTGKTVLLGRPCYWEDSDLFPRAFGSPSITIAAGSFHRAPEQGDSVIESRSFRRVGIPPGWHSAGLGIP
jgi:hypothetical protein